MGVSYISSVGKKYVTLPCYFSPIPSTEVLRKELDYEIVIMIHRPRH